MKKPFILFAGIIFSLTVFAVNAVKLKLTTPEEETETGISDDFPKNLIDKIGKYLKVNEKLATIEFTSKKQSASDFEIEECVKTTLGSVYYRVIYQDAVLIWDETQEMFALVSIDYKITPIKTQIHWLTMLRWLSNSTELQSLENHSIKIIIE